MKINQFTIDMRKNMELLISLSDVFEQKTIYEIEKTRISIMDILSFQDGDPKTKMNMVKEKIETITNLIKDNFENLVK